MPNSKLNDLFQKQLSRRDFLKFTGLAIISLFGVSGVITELLSHAETPYASGEAENGTPGGITTTLKDTAASGGEAVQFGTPPTTTSGTQTLGLGIAIGAGDAFMNAADHGLAQYKRMKSLGIESVRIDVPDYSNGAIPAYTDPIIQTALSAGLEVLLIIDGYYDASSSSQFLTWCNSVVSHYAPQGIHYYEVMNEVNMQANWGPGGQSVVNPAAYTALLGQCYKAIKAADPKSQVLFSGMASGIGDGSSAGNGNYIGTLSPPTFVGLCYAAMTNNSSTGYFDIMNVHPYSYTALPNLNSYTWQEDLNPTATSTGPGSNPSVRNLMISHGDTNKPIWITEFGAPTGTAGGYGSTVSVAQEADMLTTAYSILASQDLNFVERLYAYKWEDDSDDDFGLVDVNYNDKSFAANSYSGQPANVTSVLEAYTQGVTYPSAFGGTIYT